VLLPNQIVASRYRVVRHIADGGMGAVYEAEHLATEARVALKLLLPQMMLVANARRRFELEARVAARVNSEHIVKVFDAGVDPDTGSPYLAMELLAGETLAMRVRDAGRLDAKTVIEILRQVARGLDAAHGYRTTEGAAQPIVHRDLKPENLFLVRRGDGSLLVKILDFGIAKVLSESTEVSQQVRGTPLYMAFEQAAGEAVSPQTDIWAFRLVAFFALTGRRYWPAASKTTGGTEALFAEILTLPLPRPSQRVRDEGLDLLLPSAFDHWLLTCIERTPSRRYGSAGLAVDALERALSSVGSVALGAAHAGFLRSRITATYELPSASVSSGSSVTSVPPVAAEPGRSGQRSSGWSARVKWSAAISLACLSGSAVAWSVSRLRLSGGTSHPSQGLEALTSGVADERKATLPRPRTVEVITSERSATVTTSSVPQTGEPTNESSAAGPGQTRRPEVKVQALNSEATRDAPGATAPSRRLTVRGPAALGPAVPDPAVRRQEVPKPTGPAVPRPARSAGGVANPLPRVTPEPPPAQHPEAPAACDAFDPYTGRCATVSVGASPTP
jgi:serine/threonine protein kinase